MPCGSTTAFLGVMMIFAFMLAREDSAKSFHSVRGFFERRGLLKYSQNHFSFVGFADDAGSRKFHGGLSSQKIEQHGHALLAGHDVRDDGAQSMKRTARNLHRFANVHF